MKKRNVILLVVVGWFAFATLRGWLTHEEPQIAPTAASDFVSSQSQPEDNGSGDRRKEDLLDAALIRFGLLTEDMQFIESHQSDDNGDLVVVVNAEWYSLTNQHKLNAANRIQKIWMKANDNYASVFKITSEDGILVGGSGLTGPWIRD